MLVGLATSRRHLVDELPQPAQRWSAWWPWADPAPGPGALGSVRTALAEKLRPDEPIVDCGGLDLGLHLPHGRVTGGRWSPGLRRFNPGAEGRWQAQQQLCVGLRQAGPAAPTGSWLVTTSPAAEVDENGQGRGIAEAWQQVGAWYADEEGTRIVHLLWAPAEDARGR